MELPLIEVFYSLAVVETDAAKIWAAMLKSYPAGHFDGVLEDKYGGKFVPELERQITARFQQTLEDCNKFVQKSTERLSMQIRARDFQLKQKASDFERMADAH